MQVKSRSRKFYKCYFDLIETLKTEEVYPFGVGSFCATKVFFLSSNENAIGGKKYEKKKILRSKRNLGIKMFD